MTEREERFERMLESVLKSYAETSAKMESLKSEGKTKTATFRQLMGEKLMYGNMLSIYKAHGLIDRY